MHCFCHFQINTKHYKIDMFRWLISSPSSGTGNEGARENKHPVDSHTDGNRSGLWEVAISEYFIV
jgi:hypothetical protein